jgi:hypothetical protein
MHSSATAAFVAEMWVGLCLNPAIWETIAATGWGRIARQDWPLVAEGVEEGGGGGEEEATGGGAAEVEETVVVAGRAADEHVFEHLLGGARGAAVADEVGTEFSLAGFTERHVVAEDFQLFAIFVDGGEGTVGVFWFDGVAELDVGEFLAADDVFLLLGGERVPLFHIVKILLDDYVAAGGVVWVIGFGDESGVERGEAARVFGAVDEAEEVAIVEIAEAVGFVDFVECGGDSGHDLGDEFEAEVHALRAKMEEEVGGSRWSVAVAGAEFFEGVEFRGARIVGEEFVPGVGTEGGDAREATFDAAEVDGAVDAGEVGDEVADGGVARGVGLDGGNEEDGGACERGEDGLRCGGGFVGAGCGHGWAPIYFGGDGGGYRKADCASGQSGRHGLRSQNPHPLTAEVLHPGSI